MKTNEELLEENTRLLAKLDLILQENRRLCSLAEDVEVKWCDFRDGHCHSIHSRNLASEILDNITDMEMNA